MTGAGTVVDTFEGADDVKKAVENFWSTPTPTPPTKAAGLNRFEWNLRYKGATKFEGMIMRVQRHPRTGPNPPPPGV